jgi:hypothetical protein
MRKQAIRSTLAPDVACGAACADFRAARFLERGIFQDAAKIGPLVGRQCGTVPLNLWSQPSRENFPMTTLKSLLVGSVAAATISASLSAFAADSTAVEAVNSKPESTPISTTNTHITYKFNLSAGETRTFELPNVTGLPVRLMAVLILNQGQSIPGPASEIQAVIAFDPSAEYMTWLGQNADGTPSGDLLTPPVVGSFTGAANGSITANAGFDAPHGKDLMVVPGTQCGPCTYYVTMDY